MRPVVLAMINDRGPFRLLVETGSTGSHLVPKAYARAVNQSNLSGRTFRAANVRLGSTALAHGISFSMIASLGLTDIDGLLGLDAFRGTLTTIDFAGGELRLSLDTLPEANGRDIVALGTALGFWTVPLVFPGDTVDAIIDTQSGFSVSGPPVLARPLSFTTAPVLVGRARGVFIGDVPVQQARLDGAIRIGDATLVKPIIDLFALPAPLPADKFILGLQVLRNFTLTLDQRTRRARFARVDREIPAPPLVRSSGISAIVQANGTRLVRNVIAGLPAAAAGIREGDVILTIDGRSSSLVTETDWRTATHRGQRIRLRVKRNDVEREVSWIPQLVGF